MDETKEEDSCCEGLPFTEVETIPYGTLHSQAPYVRTPPQSIAYLWDTLLKPSSSDFVLDLGCGKGNVLLYAVQHYSCRALGVDISPSLISFAEKLAEEHNVTSLLQFRVCDFLSDLSWFKDEITIVYIYGVPRQINSSKLKEKLCSLYDRGVKIVCYENPIEGFLTPSYVDSVFRFFLYQKSGSK